MKRQQASGVCTRGRQRHRGQLLLTTAVIVALSLLVIFIFISSTVSILPTGSNTANTMSAPEFIEEIDRTLARVLREMGVEAGSDTQTEALDTTRSAAVVAVDGVELHAFERSGGVENTTISTLTPGKTVLQSDPGPFLNGSSGGTAVADWHIGEFDAIRDYTMSVEVGSGSLATLTDGQRDPDTLSTPSNSDAFRVTVSGAAGNEWTGYVGTPEPGSGDGVVLLTTVNGDLKTDCQLNTTAETAHIDWTRGVLTASAGTDTQTCNSDRDIVFGRGTTAPVSITYQRGDEVEGTYSLVTTSVVSASGVNSSNLFSTSSSDSPRYHHSTYDLTATVRYTSDTQTLVRELYIAPGESPALSLKEASSES
jgi:hypothetical protein